MARFKKTSMSIFAIGVTCLPSAFATSYFAGIDALYLQPRNDDLDYVGVFNPNGSFQISNLDPDFQWGFRLYTGKEFNNSNDVTLSWQHLHSSNSGDTLGGLDSPIFPKWLFVSIWQNIHGHATFDYDEVYAVLAHTQNLQSPWQVRYGFGPEYARIHSEINVSAFNLNSSIAVGHSDASHFNGIGPRFEGNLFYNLNKSLNVFINANTALLIGDRDVSLNATDKIDNTSKIYSGHNTVVPKVGLQLGINYSQPIGIIGGAGNVATTIDLQAGWQTETYFSAIEHAETGIIGGEGASLLTTKTSNYNNQGVFLGGKLRTNCL